MNGDWEDVLPAARDLYTGWDAHAAQESDSGWTGVSERAAEQIGDDAVKRSRVFSECLAKLAAPEGVIIRKSTDGPVPVYPEIKGFRVKCLGDKLLTPQQAWALLTSPVAAHWRRFVFKKLRIPVVGHAYQVTEGMNDKRSLYSLVEVPLPSSKVEAIKDRRPLPAGVWELPEKREKARSNETLKRELEVPGGSWEIVPYPGEDGRTHRVLVKQRSVPRRALRHS